MNLQDAGLAWGWLAGGGLLCAAALFWAVRTAPWFKIQDKEAQHVFLGMTVIVLLLWNSGASLGGGITFHLLLAALTTLMFGAQFAILCMSVALLGVTILGNAGWMAYGLNMVMMGVVPILIVWWIAILAYKYLDRNFFVFVLLNGFFAAGISSVVSLLVAAAVMGFSGVQSLETLERSFIPYIPLMAIPEGFVNGMLILALVLMKPEWVSCFTDEQYLNGK
ncbi:MAG: energy-coupling factor ABC transporter permease [Hydrogenovibrio sp.]